MGNLHWDKLDIVGYILFIPVHILARIGVGLNLLESYLYWKINIGLSSGLIETKLVECFCILKGECSAPSALHGQNAMVPRSHQISGTGGNPVVKSPSGDQSRTKGQGGCKQSIVNFSDSE